MFDFLTFLSVYLVFGEITIFILCKVWKSKNNEIQVFSLALVLRILTTYGYYMYSLQTSADTTMYFHTAQNSVIKWSTFFTPGTQFICNLSVMFYPFVTMFDNRYLMLFLPFSFLAFCGSLVFYRTLKPLYASRIKKTELYLLSFFLPNMIFWTSNLGKDSIIYLGIMLIFYGVLNGPYTLKTIVSIVVGGVLVYFVRPHVVFFLLVGFGIGIFLERYVLSIRSIVLLLVVTVAFLATYQYIFKEIGIQSETENSTELNNFYDAGVNRMESGAMTLRTGGAATQSSAQFKIWSSPMYLIRFLGSPFVWQAKKPIQLGSAIENILYQYFILYIIINWKIYRSTKLLPYKYGLLMYTVFGSIIMGMTYTNFGLTVRQKCMVLPCILLFYACVRTQKILNIKAIRIEKTNKTTGFSKKYAHTLQA
jgi:hypothetical protein